jgi:hypothetical protein
MTVGVFVIGGSTRKLFPSRILSVLVGGVLLACLAVPTSALGASPWWHLTSGARPSDLQAGSEGQIVVTATNLGDADANGEAGDPINIADKLSAGLSATGVEGFVEETKSGGGSERIPLTCTPTPLQCSYTGIIAPYRQLQVLIDVTVEHDARSGEVNEATVSGGEAPSVSASRGVLIGDGMPFGLKAYEIRSSRQAETRRRSRCQEEERRRSRSHRKCVARRGHDRRSECSRGGGQARLHGHRHVQRQAEPDGRGPAQEGQDDEGEGGGHRNVHLLHLGGQDYDG